MINRVLIIEDEKLNADRIKRLLLELRPELTILGLLDSVKDSVAWLAENDSPDMIMMDVRLADGLSFEIFDQVDVVSPVIFTTAYDEYAVRAFKHNGVDYLLKPIDRQELQRSIERHEFITQKLQGTDPSIEKLLATIRPKEYKSRFLLPFRDGFKTISVDDVCFFSSEMNVTFANLFTGGQEVIPHPLEKLEKRLDPKMFFRANRKYIIHIGSISGVHNYFNGKLKIDIRGYRDEEVIVSRDKAPLFKVWLDS